MLISAFSGKATDVIDGRGNVEQDSKADTVVLRIQQHDIPAYSSTQLHQNVSYITSIDHGNDNTNEQAEYVHYGYKPVDE